ncbi:hypothetical protein [Sulfobacillus sp. hq2]|uniref:hypothetical protein n=1 Tax=Sulfobacillus TaxID=28033 RepID=UPI001304E597|nr:hypothetical protein [Sulfobacillus sp. hq2]
MAIDSIGTPLSSLEYAVDATLVLFKATMDKRMLAISTYTDKYRNRKFKLPILPQIG